MGRLVVEFTGVSPGWAALHAGAHLPSGTVLEASRLSWWVPERLGSGTLEGRSLPSVPRTSIQLCGGSCGGHGAPAQLGGRAEKPDSVQGPRSVGRSRAGSVEAGSPPPSMAPSPHRVW